MVEAKGRPAPEEHTAASSRRRILRVITLLHLHLGSTGIISRPRSSLDSWTLETALTDVIPPMPSAYAIHLCIPPTPVAYTFNRHLPTSFRLRYQQWSTKL
nr:PREDICTED: uncharacterized protein LOC109038710 [Bemisia tabaci]